MGGELVGVGGIGMAVGWWGDGVVGGKYVVGGSNGVVGGTDVTVGGNYIMGGVGITVGGIDIMDVSASVMSGVDISVGGNYIVGGADIIMGGADIIVGGTFNIAMQQEGLSGRDGLMGVKKNRWSVGVRISRRGRWRNHAHQS